MSTTFPITTTGITAAGCDPTKFTVDPYDQLGLGSRLDLVIHGTDATIRCFNNAGNGISIVVDGGSPVTPTFTSGWNLVPLFSGLTDGPHDVTITAVSHNSFLPDFVNTFVVSGSSPAISYRSGYNKCYQPQTVSSAFMPVGTGLVKNGSSDGTFCAYAYALDASIEFKATCTGINLYLYDGSAKWLLSIDGTEQAEVTIAAAGGTWSWNTAFTGLDGANEHLYKLSQVSTSANPYCIGGLMVTGGNVNESAIITLPKQAWFEGDSITNVASNGGSGEVTIGHPHLFGRALGYQVANMGTPGANTPTASQLDTHMTPPNEIFPLWGTNDIAAGTAQSTFQANYNAYLNDLHAKFPSARINVMGILPRGDSFASGVATYNGYIQTQVATWAAANPSASIRYVDMTGVINPTTGGGTNDTLDQLHPSSFGYAKIAARLESLFAGGSVYHVPSLAGGHQVLSGGMAI